MQVIDPALHFLEPNRRRCQPVGRSDVEHQEAVEVSNGGRGIDVRGEKIGMPRLHAAVAANIDVPTLLGGDDSEVLALRLGALAHATADGALELVRRTNALLSALCAA